MDGENSEAVQTHTKRACAPCALASGLHVHARMRCRKYERARFSLEQRRWVLRRIELAMRAR
jgi:hypothetical protein